MEPQNTSVGLDIGTTKIVAMLGRTNEYGKLQIVGTGKSQSLGVHRDWTSTILRLAISRALCAVDEDHRAVLKPEGLLTRDPRMVERKKFGPKSSWIFLKRQTWVEGIFQFLK